MAVNKKKAKKQPKKRPEMEVNEAQIYLKNMLDFQEYGQVQKVLGNNRYEVNCLDGKIRLAHARGNLKKKKLFIKLNDVVLVSLREFEDAKCDILHPYNQKEVKLLKKMEEIPSTLAEETAEVEEDIGFEITDDVDDEIEPQSLKELNFEAI